jgi:hypothetical protein
MPEWNLTAAQPSFFCSPMSRHEDNPAMRATALLAALCVFVLTLLAANPEWHASLHAHAAAQSAPVGSVDHECAVTLFAAGAEALLVFCLLLLVRPLVRSVMVRAVNEIAAARPRYLLVPSCGPPLA